MNIFTQKNVVAGQIFAMLTAFSMLLSALPVHIFVAQASASVLNSIETAFTNPTGKVSVCHEGGSNSVNVSAIVGGTGHGGHESDIIPSFWHNLDDQDPIFYPGNNWDATGEEIWNDGACDGGEEEPTVSSETIVVTGDTIGITGGWWFNRDANNATPIEFNTDQASIGVGSLYVEPLPADAPRKFIGEFYSGQKIADTGSFSYDFRIGVGGDASDENEFYMNVYANYGESDPAKYYDCKYDVVPTVGSTGSFTTVTFDPTQAYPVTTRTGGSASPYTCPAIPADMDDDSEDSVFRMFALNMGDTSANDENLDGHFDNVVNVVTTGSNTHTTTFDFEPEEEVIECTVTLYSDDTDFVVETNDTAEELSFIHNAWTAVINGATWIWGQNPVVNPVADEIQTFQKKFGFNGPVTSATLFVAADNSYEADLNGSAAGADATEKNFNAAGQDTHDVTTLINQGNNELEIAVKNWGGNGNPTGNPAGLLYKLEIVGSHEQCDVPYEEPAVIVAHKIICEDEALLPNWGGGAADISSSTAATFVAENEGCEFVEGWEFQWAQKGTSDPGDTLVGTAGSDWNTFDPTDANGMTSIELLGSDIGKADYVWMREVLQEGYIPFTHEADKDNNNDVSAEMYCHTDAKNYDNFDRVDDIEGEETFYCVAFNAEKDVPKPVCEIGENLLVNGSFEEPVVTDHNGKWELFDVIPGWTSNIAPNGIELQRGLFGGASDGEQHAELDVHEATELSQTVSTLPGATYELRFDFSARDANAANNSVAASADAVALVSTSTSNLDWTTYAQTFVADASTDIMFADMGTSNGHGTLIDNAVLCLVEEAVAALEITNPAVDGTTLSGEHTFAAEYTDDDPTVDHINWAIRAGTCAAGTNTVAGNVDGFNDAWSFVGIDFTTTVDMTTWDAGEYCLVVNPSEGGGEDLRETRSFFIEDTIAYAPYCGDGVVGSLVLDGVQDWEQCEVGEKGCTDYCTFDNQCQDLRLVQITMEPTASVSFDDMVYLGSSTNPLPNGTWFNFDELGDDSLNDIAEDDNGLAVSRDTVNEKLLLGFRGSNDRRDLDKAAGVIKTLGINLGAIDTTIIPGWKLEAPGEGFPDVFVENDNEVIFDLRADTGNDAVSVEVKDGEEHDCPECKATVEARVVLSAADGSFGNTGAGNLAQEVMLGDGSVYDFGEWFPISEELVAGDSATYINDPKTVTDFDAPEDTEGIFVSREGDGTVKLALYGYHTDAPGTEYITGTLEFRDTKIASGSAEALNGSFKLENHSNGRDTISERGDLSGVDFDLWVDTAADGFKVSIDESETLSCDDDTIDSYRLEGIKWNDANGNGEWDEETLIPGWTIYAYNGEDEPLSTTTDANGYYYFDVPAGEWEVYEEEREGWMQTAALGEDFHPYLIAEDEEYDEYMYESCHFSPGEEMKKKPQFALIPDFIEDLFYDDHEYDEYICDFGNQEVEDTNGGDVLGCSISADSLFVTEGDTVELTWSTTDGSFAMIDNGIGDVDLSGSTSTIVSASTTFTMTVYDQSEDEATCSVTIDAEPAVMSTSNGGSSGGGGRRVSDEPEGIVLGAATTQCSIYLYDYMREGIANDVFEVQKLQIFLISQGAYLLPITGVFDAATDAAVRQFQATHQGDVLLPWFEAGLATDANPTGYVYKTTRWKINNIVCPGSEAMPELN
ncbi:MAG: hypothetical protein ACI9H6_000613 [Patiriisocius sp.]|jgi:hypothetical protein